MDNLYIKKVLKGDIGAFTYFVSNYKQFAISLSYSILKNEYLAEEVVQESFIKAYDKLSTFNHKSSFKTWFGRIIINESLKNITTKRNLQSVDETSDLEIEEVEDAMNSIIKSERRHYISHVFEQLSPEESLILELYYLKEFSVKEISAMTNWSPSKVKMLNLRGRKSFYIKLHRILKSEIKKIL